MNSLRLILLALLLAGFLVSPSVAQIQPAVHTLQEYFDLLASYNVESAGYLWSEAIQERAGRFGIIYEDIPIKADCASPYIQELDKYRFELTKPVKRWEKVDQENFIKLTQTIRHDRIEVAHDYYAQKIGGYYWLSAPQDYLARDWPIVVSKYFRIHVHPDVEKYVNRQLLNNFDSFLKETADKLKIDDETVEQIEREKIEYFYCDTDQTVEQICGHLTRGLMDMATNDIISAAFPHFHEVVHLLINIKLKELPLFSLPLLREGLAVKYGGRWGKRPEALMDLAAFLVREHLVELDSMLTYKDFSEVAQADIAYPVAGQFVSFLMERIGFGKFFQMYREFSGSSETVYGFDTEDVRSKLLQYTDHKDWLDLTLDFGRQIELAIKEEAVIAPGTGNKAREILSRPGFRVLEDDDWFCFEFSSEATGPPLGNLLFGPAHEGEPLVSSLFENQYHGQLDREGYRFGIRYDQFEAGLYDYLTNELAAKYILGIAPSADYFDPEQNIIRLRIRKSLIHNFISGSVSCRLLPN